MIRTVVAPVDFTPATSRELDLAVEVCRSFGARLVVHHNEDAAPLGLSRAWDWQEAHGESQGRRRAVETRLAELLRQLPETVTAEAMISRGLTVPALLVLARELPADLLVVSTHGETGDDHSSVAERLIADAPCPVLTLHESEGAGFRLTSRDEESVPVVVATDLSAGGTAALDYAFALARRLPLSLHLVHVLEGGADERAVETTRGALAGVVPEDFAWRVQTHLLTGRPAERVPELCRRLGAAFLVAGEHARDLLRHLFTHDTARDLLRRAPCPVWYVPPARA